MCRLCLEARFERAEKERVPTGVVSDEGDRPLRCDFEGCRKKVVWEVDFVVIAEHLCDRHRKASPDLEEQQGDLDEGCDRLRELLDLGDTAREERGCDLVREHFLAHGPSVEPQPARKVSQEVVDRLAQLTEKVGRRGEVELPPLGHVPDLGEELVRAGEPDGEPREAEGPGPIERVQDPEPRVQVLALCEVEFPADHDLDFHAPPARVKTDRLAGERVGEGPRLGGFEGRPELMCDQGHVTVADEAVA